MNNPLNTINTTIQLNTHNINTILPTLCLNMIVKNESRIIVRLLETVVDIIDRYCICDTGSTDNTIEVIETFFKSKNIPGQIVKEPFRDFGYNRTFALNAACGQLNAACTVQSNSNDYILLLDADMVFWRNPNISVNQFKQNLIGSDIYYIYQGSDHFFYKNTRIVKNRPGFSYWGVTHEYVQAPKDAISTQLKRTDCFIQDIGDGGCKSDKFLRDIKLLTQGLKDFPNNDRYTFYLANSYRDSGQNEKAIETYKQRTLIGGWIEEIWQSFYNIGKCYKILNDMPNAIYYWLEAYNCYPNRIENLYEIIHHYRNIGKNEVAYTFYTLANNQRKKYPSLDYLFLQKDVYDYKLDYELSIIGYYCNHDKHDLAKLSMQILAHSGIDEGIGKNVLSNYKFYSKNIMDMIKGYTYLSEQNRQVLQSTASFNMTDFTSSTPSMCYTDNGNIMICVRYVNYKIDEGGNYINQNCIETKNVISRINVLLPEWRKVDETILEYDKTFDNVYVGLEDVRLMTLDNDAATIYYSANRGLGSNNIVVEYGKVDELVQENDCIRSITTSIPCTHLTKPNQSAIEKNWSIFDSNNSVKCIYKWSPLTVGNIENGQFETIAEIQTPHFFKYMRGSTPGVVMGDEVWFINHIVSYEDRRYYYHSMVVLDRTTYALKRYSPLWTFEKAKVEYTLGFVYMAKHNQFLIGYSIMDRETKYTMVPKHVFEDMMMI
jgi:hypothetical protein